MIRHIQCARWDLLTYHIIARVWSFVPMLTHWGRVTHICVSKRTIIGSDNGLSPSRRQAIIWTNAGILLIGPSGTIFSEILIEIITFSFKKMRLKVSSAKWQPCCLGLNVLMYHCWYWWCMLWTCQGTLTLTGPQLSLADSKYCHNNLICHVYKPSNSITWVCPLIHLPLDYMAAIS